MSRIHNFSLFDFLFVGILFITVISFVGLIVGFAGYEIWYHNLPEYQRTYIDIRELDADISRGGHDVLIGKVLVFEQYTPDELELKRAQEKVLKDRLVQLQKEYQLEK